MDIARIAEDFAVAAQIQADDVGHLAAAGFTVIICNRPDGEEPGQPTAADIAAACDAAGIAFHHIPFASMPIAAELIDELRRVLAASDGLVLGYCRSGQRSQMIWSATR